MNALVSVIAQLAFFLFWGSMAYQALHFVRVETLKTISRGLSPSEPFAQKLTGYKFDKNFNLVPLKQGGKK